MYHSSRMLQYICCLLKTDISLTIKVVLEWIKVSFVYLFEYIKHHLGKQLNSFRQWVLLYIYWYQTEVLKICEMKIYILTDGWYLVSVNYTKYTKYDSFMHSEIHSDIEMVPVITSRWSISVLPIKAHNLFGTIYLLQGYSMVLIFLKSCYYL